MSLMRVKLFLKSCSTIPWNARCKSYKSAISIDKLYPNSVNLKPFKPPENAEGKFTVYSIEEYDQEVTEIFLLWKICHNSKKIEKLGLGYIPIKELKMTSMVASGPGGQHVNKTETKIEIKFHVESATWLNEDTKKKLIEKYYTRINKDGYFVIRSEKTRSKILNQADAMTYLRELIFKLEEPEPELSIETLEKIRKNKEKAARNRLKEKRTRSLIRSFRECP